MRKSRTFSITAIGSIAIALALSACSAAAPTTSEPTSAANAVQADQALFDKLPDAIKSSKSITVGTEALYPPYEYLDTDGTTVIGLDIELLDAATKRLGISYNLVNTSFDGLLPGLESARYDLAWAAFSDTKARQEKFDFVDYFLAPQAIVVAAGNPKGITTVQDLCGHPVSVLTSSAQESLLNQFNTEDCASNPIQITSLPSDTDALLQVQSGRADATFTQEPVGRWNAAQIGGGNAFEVSNTEPLFPTLLGVAVTKDNTELRDALQAALQSLVDDGTYGQILDARELSSGSVSEITINGSTE